MTKKRRSEGKKLLRNDPHEMFRCGNLSVGNLLFYIMLGKTFE